jgi:hypothetical protein
VDILHALLTFTWKTIFCINVHILALQHDTYDELVFIYIRDTCQHVIKLKHNTLRCSCSYYCHINWLRCDIFWKYLFVKIAARPNHIVVTWTPRHCARCSSLNHIGTVPGVKWHHYLSWAKDKCEFFWQIGISKIWIPS